MMVALAGEDGTAPLSVRELAESQEVPYAFARSVQRDLVAAGLVRTHRGAAGGLTLGRTPESITLLDIVTATQGEPSMTVCSHDPTWCARSGGCRTHSVWLEVDQVVREMLGNRTLRGLLAK